MKSSYGDSIAYDLGDLSDLSEGQMRTFPIPNKHNLLVCRIDGKLHAVENNCSHADTPLSEGRLRGYSLTCPRHGVSFDVRDGIHSGPPAAKGIQIFNIEESDNGTTIYLKE